MGLMTFIGYLFVFLFGIIAGDFINICIYHFFEKKKILVKTFYNKECEHRLRLPELVFLSFSIFTKKKCVLYYDRLIVELLNATLYMCIFVLNGFSISSLISCFFVSSLLILSFVDWKIYEIPPKINIFILIIGIINLLLDLKNFTDYIIGFFLVSTILIILYVLTKGKAIGGGDIKLMAVAGLMLGFERIFLAFFIGCVLATVIYIIQTRFVKTNGILALGPYLSAGIIISLLWGNKLLEWYYTVL